MIVERSRMPVWNPEVAARLIGESSARDWQVPRDEGIEKINDGRMIRVVVANDNFQFGRRPCSFCVCYDLDPRTFVVSNETFMVQEREPGTDRLLLDDPLYEVHGSDSWTIVARYFQKMGENPSAMGAPRRRDPVPELHAVTFSSEPRNSRG